MSEGSLYDQLDRWYNSCAGLASLPLIHRQLTELQQDLSGHYAICCGPRVLFEGMQSSKGITKYFYIHQGTLPGQMRARPEALPLDSGSIDLMVLTHVLELSDQPHTILREVNRVLVPNGHLLLMGFNPWSWYGLYRWLTIGRFPWNRHFYGTRRMRDWLSVLNFSIEDQRYAAFRPPLQNQTLQSYMSGLETRARWRIDRLGGVYCLRARKLRVPLTIQPEHWYQRAGLMPETLVTKPLTCETIDHAK